MAFMGVFLVFGAMAVILLALFIITIAFFAICLALFIVFTCLRKKNKACKIIHIITIPFLVISTIPVAIFSGILIHNAVMQNVVPADYVECPTVEFNDLLYSFYDKDGNRYVQFKNVIYASKMELAEETPVFSYKPEGAKKQDWVNIYASPLPSGISFYKLRQRTNGFYGDVIFYIAENEVAANDEYNETHYIDCFDSDYSNEQKQFLDTLVNTYPGSGAVCSNNGYKLFDFERKDSYGYVRTHMITLSKTSEDKIILSIDNGRIVHGWYDEGLYECTSYQLTETDNAKFLELFC